MKQVERVLKRGDLHVGSSLPWSLFDRNGQLLLPERAMIVDISQIERLLAHGARYYQSGPRLTPAHETDMASFIEQNASSPLCNFTICESMLEKLRHAFRLADEDDGKGFVCSIMMMTVDIQYICSTPSSAESIMGAMHLMFDFPHGLVHPLHNAILCEIVERYMGISDFDRMPLIAAALTHDMGIRDISQQLFNQKTPLTAEQQQRIKEHPVRGCDILKNLGVNDERWLTPVLHHHERLDGSGYPHGISGDKICHGSRLMAIVDSYSAMIRPRRYKKAALPKDAFSEIFAARNKSIDGELAAKVVNALGLFSPGSLVRLEDKRIALVVGKGVNAKYPRVAIITDAEGDVLDTPTHYEITESSVQISDTLNPAEYELILSNAHSVWPQITPPQVNSLYR